jgi:hypothetical protein
MYQQFTASRAEQHRSDLFAAAEHARTARRRAHSRTLRLRLRRPQLPSARPATRPLLQLQDAH